MIAQNPEYDLKNEFKTLNQYQDQMALYRKIQDTFKDLASTKDSDNIVKNKIRDLQRFIEDKATNSGVHALLPLTSTMIAKEVVRILSHLSSRMLLFLKPKLYHYKNHLSRKLQIAMATNTNFSLKKTKMQEKICMS